MSQHSLGSIWKWVGDPMIGIGVILGVVVNHFNLKLLGWTLGRASEVKHRKWIALLYYVRFISLVLIVYAAYHLIGLKLVLGILVGMLVHKIFFVIQNVKSLFQKDTNK